jgi:hypothetical protein
MMEFTIRHDDEGLKSLYHNWWKQEHGLRNAWASGMLLLCFMVMFLMKSAAWYLVVPTVASACFLGLVQTIRYQATKSALDAFSTAGRPALSYQAAEGGLTEISPMGRIELPWNSFAGMVRIGRFWVLHRGPLFNAQFVALPEAQLPLAAREFMLSRVNTARRGD